MKIGIIGTNFISDMFIDALSYQQEVKAVAVCSGKFENALKFKEKHQLEYAYENYQKMLADHQIEAVYIAAPNSTHYEIAKDCLNAGYHVFCEKPFMLNHLQAQEIYAIADKKHVFIHDGILPLYTENFQILKAKLREVGKIRSVVFSFQKYSSRYEAYLKGENPTTFRKELGNGSMMDLGIYILAIAIALFGKPLNIYANSTKIPDGVDLLGKIILKYEDFEVLLLHSKVNNSKIISEICGEKGIIQIEKPSLMEDIYLINDDQKNKLSKDELNSFVYQINDFNQNIKEHNQESLLVSRNLSLTILETLTHARKLCGIIFKQD